MNDLISIIVPVYNSGLYLNSCIHSVLQQTFPHYELILVDDGSQDESEIICEKACKADQRIRFIRQTHQGVSAARNRALNAAKGNYLFFLDSDDMIHPYLLEVLYTTLSRTHSTMAATEYCFIENNDPVKPIIKTSSTQYFSDYIHINNQTVLDMFVQGHTLLLYGTGGIMIHRNNLKIPFFDERLPNGEDTKFIYQMLLLGADTLILNKPWYYYRKYETASSKTRTLKSYHSMYKCECYIRNGELKNHRIINAAAREQILLNRICDWYMTAKLNHDLQLCNYLKRIALHEYKSCNFPQISAYNKFKFLLAFYCSPLYYAYAMASTLIAAILHYCDIY